MLTLKHFLDNPTWAAADGYDFNYFDCMAYTAKRYDDIFSALHGVVDNFLDTEVREIPLVMVVLLLAISGVVIWPLTFWLTAIWVWVRCRYHRQKYQFGNGMTDVARANLDNWKARFDRANK
ncbi:hypothetical protein HV170_03380 [Citrobacter freundii]|jgi:hypothetical protein|uniref:hypothetical protein n=1 Tax=Citrobacter freundii TaxID=546 RepID=UPI0015F62147|nr:hypothetical protein [Citrobacter freundii]